MAVIRSSWSVAVMALRQIDQIVVVRLAGGLAPDAPPVAEHRHLVGDGEDLVEAMRDEQDRGVLRGQLPKPLEQTLGLVAGEPGRRLVQDEHPRPRRQGEGQLDERLLGPSKGSGGTTDVQRRDRGRAGLGRLLLQAPPGDRADRGARVLSAQSEVLPDRELGDQVGSLVDDRDPGPAGVAGRVERDRETVPPDLAGVGPLHAGEDLDQRRLAGTVLADEGVDESPLELEPHTVQGNDTRVPFREGVRLEGRAHEGLRLPPAHPGPQSCVRSIAGPGPELDPGGAAG
jgi:hypothetical protein